MRTANCFIGPIQAHVAPSLGDPVSSRTIQMRLVEGHLGSRNQLHVLLLIPIPSTPPFGGTRKLDCNGWNQVVFSDESRFNLCSDGSHVCVW
ncbi:hypothetical protein TNCV_4119091 [Trichonephila clavipes]|nr:hypothetical protein TNCV_4119091 [Trichonephila clavipes]